LTRALHALSIQGLQRRGVATQPTCLAGIEHMARMARASAAALAALAVSGHLPGAVADAAQQRGLRGAAADQWHPQRAACPADTAWIVVGGGGAGCAAAAALADAGESVLVLERGPSDKDIPSTQAMSGWPASVNDAGQTIRWTDGVWGVVAKVLGGGTSLNGGLYFADSPEYFSETLPGVNQTMLYESYNALRQELATPSQMSRFGAAWNDALEEEDYGVANLNEPQMQWIPDQPFVPYSTFNQSAPGAPRLSAAHLLHKRADLPNLKVVTGALVKQVVFNGTEAMGVRVQIGWESCSLVKASKGVLLSAGAILTPQLLQVSGVGPRQVLHDLGVEMISELPGVGENFIDRNVISAGFISPQGFPLTMSDTVYIDPERNLLLEGVGGGEIGSQLSTTSLAFVPPAARTHLLQVALTDLMSRLDKMNLTRYINQMIQPVALNPNTLSRGHVKARSKDVRAMPAVTPNFFADQADMTSQMTRFRALLDMTNAPALKGYTVPNVPLPDAIAEQINKTAPQIWEAMSCLFRAKSDNIFQRILVPCPRPVEWSDAYLEKYLREFVISSYHYFGTAAAGSVVDGKDFSVVGTQKLYVADASVLPRATHVNPQGTVMALGHLVGRLLAGEQR